jgi:predicted secreted Zn-dependent protease
VKIIVRLLLLVACFASAPGIARAEWQAVENVQTYAIAGKSGADLYASIGEKGPKVGGMTRAIAHTNFKLTWSRKYEAQGGACALVSARPKLIITYTLPKPADQLQPAAAKNWETFIAGVRSHEVVHGDMIKDMVKAIESSTVGMSVPDDPNCHKIKTELTKRLSELSLAQRQRSRDFDRTELSKGGNIHQLILALVNGS